VKSAEKFKVFSQLREGEGEREMPEYTAPRQRSK